MKNVTPSSPAASRAARTAAFRASQTLDTRKEAHAALDALSRAVYAYQCFSPVNQKEANRLCRIQDAALVKAKLACKANGMNDLDACNAAYDILEKTTELCFAIGHVVDGTRPAWQG